MVYILFALLLCVFYILTRPIFLLSSFIVCVYHIIIIIIIIIIIRGNGDMSMLTIADKRYNSHVNNQ